MNAPPILPKCACSGAIGSFLVGAKRLRRNIRLTPPLGILAEKDPERLERWLEKAAVAASVAAVIDEPN